MKKTILWLLIIVATCLQANAQLSTTSRSDLPQWQIITGWWGTNACYSPDAIALTGGVLSINVTYQSETCNSTTNQYRAGGLISTFAFKSGTVSVRGKSAGLGVHSGITWLGDVSCNTDPNCSNDAPYYELDWNEVKPAAGGLTAVFQNFDFNNTWQSQMVTVTDTSQNFHVYTMIIGNTSVVFKVDGVTTNTFTIAPITDNMNIYLATQMDTASGGTPNPADFPQAVQVDYVRVSSSTALALDSTGAVPIANADLFDDEFSSAPTLMQNLTLQNATIQ